MNVSHIVSVLVRRGQCVLYLNTTAVNYRILDEEARDGQPTSKNPTTSDVGHRTDSGIDIDTNEGGGGYVNPVTGERGGPTGLEPTRYGDWERKGRVSDF